MSTDDWFSPATMIGQSWPEYIFIRISIPALRLIAPSSIVYLAASFYHGTFLWSPILGIYTLTEATFFLFVYLPRRFSMQRVRCYQATFNYCGSLSPQHAEHPPRMSRAQREALFHKCANTMTSESISGWFLRPSGRRICRDNVSDWLLWSLFSARTTEILQEWKEELDYYITAMADYVGYPLEPGGKSNTRCLRLTLDPVHMVHRPFLWYMVRFSPHTGVPHIY